jgi:hypothetical protein
MCLTKMNWYLRVRSMLFGAGLLILGGVSDASSASRNGQENWAGKGDFGGAGLIQTRTARSSSDGLFEVGYSTIYPYKRYYLTLQALPWLEGTFRYTEIKNRLYSQFSSFSGRQTFKDRGADISIRLLEETKLYPAIALTLQDGLGTGQFSGEYLSATKRFYDIDLTGGIAWGYGARANQMKNPLGQLFDSFATRQGGGVTGGQFNINTYFSGENIAFYGGIAYRSPIDGLVFKIEYDPNDYQAEPQGNIFKASSHINYGLNYKPFDWLETSAAFERGNSYMLRVSLLSNLHDPGLPKSDPPPQKLKHRAVVEKDLIEYAKEGVKPWWYSPVFDDVQKLIDEYLPKQAKINTANEKAVANIFDGFIEEGLRIQNIETIKTNVQVSVEELHEATSTRDYEKLAQLVVTAFPNSSDNISIQFDEISEPIVIHRKDIEYKELVDFLYQGLEDQGLAIEELNLSHWSANVVITKLNDDAQLNVMAARLIIQSLPTPVRKISIVLTSGGMEIQRQSYLREEIENDALVHELYSQLEWLNVNVESMNISGSKIEVQILDNGEAKNVNYQEISTALENTSITNLSEVSIVGKWQGNEVSRTNVMRTIKRTVENNRWLTSGDSTSKNTQTVPDWTEEDKEFLVDRLFEVLRKDGISPEAIDIRGYRVTVYGSSRKYRQVARNIGRAMRAIANNVPSEIEEFEFVSMSAGMEMSRTLINRKDLEKADAKNSSADEIWARGLVSKPNSGIFYPDSAVRSSSRYPNFNWTLKPKLRNYLGGPDQFLLYELLVTAGFDLDLWRGLNATGRVNRSIFDNFEKIQFGSSSVLPHVRTDVKEYLQESSKYSVSRLQANYYFSPFDEWYARGSVGIFERMFGGYSAEVLHRPFDSRLAVGVDVNKVRQREFDQRFRFKKYKVTTGHLNVYYELPWYDLLGSVHIGQYLAGDRGTTFRASRRFDSGVMIGVWGTFTDVSAEDFGEGSFDKGFYIRVPFELFLTNSTKQKGTFAFRPITRDGGAMLGIQGRLHGVTSGGSRGEVMRDWNDFLN